MIGDKAASLPFSFNQQFSSVSKEQSFLVLLDSLLQDPSQFPQEAQQLIPIFWCLYSQQLYLRHPARQWRTVRLVGYRIDLRQVSPASQAARASSTIVCPRPCSPSPAVTQTS